MLILRNRVRIDNRFGRAPSSCAPSRDNLLGMRRKRISELAYWSLLVAAAAVALALGYWGFAEHFAAQKLSKSFLDILYLDWQLFTMESGAVPAPVPMPLEIARILAPVVAAAAVIRLWCSMSAARSVRRVRRLRGRRSPERWSIACLWRTRTVFLFGNSVVKRQPCRIRTPGLL